MSHRTRIIRVEHDICFVMFGKVPFINTSLSTEFKGKTYKISCSNGWTTVLYGVIADTTENGVACEFKTMRFEALLYEIGCKKYGINTFHREYIKLG